MTRVDRWRAELLARATALRAALGGPAAYRWERERGDHLVSAPKGGTSRRRRGELLKRRAHRAQRAGTGVSEQTVVNDVTPRFFVRWTADADPGEGLIRMIAMGVAGVVYALALGVGTAIGYGIYRVLDAASPRIGRLWAWPWAAAAGVLALVLWLVGWLTVGVPVELVPHWPILEPEMTEGQFQASWRSWQVVAVPAAVAFYIHSWGWAAVPAKAVTPSKQNADGSWKETAEKHKVDIGFDPSALEAYRVPEHNDMNDNSTSDDGGWPEEEKM